MKLWNFEVKQMLTITDEDIGDIIDTAGYGIGYWAKSAVVDDENGLYIITDEDDQVYELRYVDIVRGVKMYIENGNKPYNIIYENGVDTCNIDSVVADMIIQYACFGEIIYG